MKKLLVFTALWSLVLPLAAAADWPQWRGPEGTGAAPAADPPVRWSETENVRWKVPIPGRGNAAPIVWGDRVYVLTAVPVEGAKPPEPPAGADEQTRQQWMRAVHPMKQRFVVMALNRRDGSVAWERTAVETVPAGTTHQDGTWASASPVTDGEAVYAQFGSQGLYAYRLDGELLWQRDLGDMRTRNGFGEGSSPAVYGDKLVVNWDHEGDSFIFVLDKKTGETVWQKPRDEITSWSTPVIVEVSERPQAVVAATGKSRGYDLATGDVVWEAGGMTVNVIPTPVYGHGLVYLISGFRGSTLQAVRLASAKGEVAGTAAMAWAYDRDTPYVPSPLLYGDQLYFLKVNSGILSCLDAKTGEVLFNEQRLEGIRNVYASPVGAGGRVYVVGREGTTVVLEHGREYKALALNTLDEGFDASPAVAGDELYLRGSEHLYCLADGGTKAAAAGP